MARLRILLIGGTGFIGSAVGARLKTKGMHVTAVARSGPEANRFGADRWLRMDLRGATEPQGWVAHLKDVDAVINCAGVLQDSARDSTAKVHREAPAALFRACDEAGVRRVIHFSAVGADKESLSAFSQTKREAEQVLERSGLDWVILRPSVVVGRAANGGSALFRGLAGLPLLPALRDAGRISIVQLDDVVDTVVKLIEADAPRQIALEMAGPEPLRFEDVIAHYRRWLGWPPARIIAVSPVLMQLAYGLGDLAGSLGWRPALRSTAAREMVRGAVADPTEWSRRTGIVPRRLEDALIAEPASVQERWFARLYFLKPLVISVFALFWIATGLISLGPGYEAGVGLMRESGVGALSEPSVIAGALADIAIGAGLLFRRTARIALYAALAVSLFYVISGTVLLPRLWIEPLGPLLKIWPILVLNLMALAILDER